MAEIEIERLDTEHLRVPLIGTAPLIMHRFGAKAKEAMLDAQRGRRKQKQARDPKAEYEEAFHRLADGAPGFPALGFKAATVSAARYYGKDVSMAALKQYLFVRGEIGTDGQPLCRIEGEPTMREDAIRLSRGGSADLRYRPEFNPWMTVLDIEFVKSALTRSSVLSLIDAGGMGVGVGDWRPEKDGLSGTYRIDSARELEIVR